MNARINDKIIELEKHISELAQISPSDVQVYSADFKTKAACERYFEKIVEAVVDVAFLIIKENRLRIPEEDKEAFDILASGEIITLDLASRLKNAKGMRNILAHEYGKIDDELVFESITEEIVDDVELFISAVKLYDVVEQKKK